MTGHFSDDDFHHLVDDGADDVVDEIEQAPVSPDRRPVAILAALWGLMWAAVVWGFDQDPAAAGVAALVVTAILGLPVVVLAAGVVSGAEALADLRREFTAPRAAPSREPTRSSR